MSRRQNDSLATQFPSPSHWDVVGKEPEQGVPSGASSYSHSPSSHVPGDHWQGPGDVQLTPAHRSGGVT